METFGDWLEYYNNLDVTPFLEALETMKAFYTNLGIDIFKNAVSLPGASMQYILRGTLKRRDPPELYAPSAEAYDMLKAAVVGGPSLVFTRNRAVGETRIRSHKNNYQLARFTKRIAGLDANSLTQALCCKRCPAEKKTVVHYSNSQQTKTVKSLVSRLRSKQWFGFMREYLTGSGRTFIQGQKKLLGVLSEKKMLLYALLLEWYLD